LRTYELDTDKKENQRIIVAIVVALLGSTGINQGLQMSLPLRSDAWTKSQAEISHLEIKASIEKRCSNIERKLEFIEYRLKRAGINGHGVP